MASFIINALLLFLAISFSTTFSLNPSSPSPFPSPYFSARGISAAKSICKATPYPDACFDSLKLSISININPTILEFLLQSLQTALSEAGRLSRVLADARASSIVEKQRGSVQDCVELHQTSLACLRKSLSGVRSRRQSDVNVYLSAALTNKNTCLEGLESSSGDFKPVLINAVVGAYRHVSNSLSILSESRPARPANGRRILGFPSWVSSSWHRVLQGGTGDGGSDFPESLAITVSGDGTGNFSTIGEAVAFAPNRSMERVIILVREGVYEENVEIPSYKTNIVLVGEGRDATVIRGNRSVGDGWTTFRSASVAVSGDGFLARDLTIENTAGPEKHQAVALRVNADLVAIYRCAFSGYQDTLYTHSFRQFYRECDIFGTVDFIFGNSAAVFQGCNIVARRPMPGQFVAVTAQSRDVEYEETGISIQNCSVLATDELWSGSGEVRSYLGRPWKPYSRTVLMESYIDGFIDPAGWTAWAGGLGLASLYYGEYGNEGPGAATDGRVDWAGYHLMEYGDALNFTVSSFIAGDEWLESTSFPYDDAI